MPRRGSQQDEFERLEKMRHEEIYLQDFVFDQKEVPFPTILLVGKRFSGKSYTSVSIAAKFDVPRWAAWCGTKDTEDFWADRFESSATVKGPDERGKQYLIGIIRYQERKSRLYKKMLKLPFPRKFRIGMIFDDVTSKREFRKGEILEDLFSNGRHYHAVIIISAQYPKQLPPAVRTNADYMFMMHNTKRSINILYEEFVEEPDEFGMFLDLIRSVTGQKDESGKNMYNALVYNNANVKTSKLDEIFKVYRVENEDYINNVKLGDPMWREYVAVVVFCATVHFGWMRRYNKQHYKDEDHETQIRDHRKQVRLQRLAQYRQQQMERRANPMAYLGAGGQDLDYLSDSDSEAGDTDAGHDTVMLKHRGGSSMKVSFNKGPAKTSAPPTQPPQQSLPFSYAGGSIPYAGGSIPYAGGSTPYAGGSGSAPSSNTMYGGGSAPPYVPPSSTMYGGGSAPPYVPPSSTMYGGGSIPYGGGTSQYSPQGRAGGYGFPQQQQYVGQQQPYGATSYQPNYGGTGYRLPANPYQPSTGWRPQDQPSTGWRPQQDQTRWSTQTPNPSLYGPVRSDTSYGPGRSDTSYFEKPPTWSAQQEFIRNNSKFVPAGRTYL